MKRFLFVVLLSLIVVPSLSWAQAAEKFKEANTAYRTGDYEVAAKLYEQLTREDPKNAVYHYDLGNAYFRSGELSKAILSLERAKLLSPRNKDIRQNLSFARSQLEYRVDDNRNWYLKAADSVLSRFTQKEMIFFALLFLFVFMSAAITYFIFKQPVFWGAGRKTLLIIICLAGALAWAKHFQSDMIRPSIVMAKECEARYGPSEHDQVAFRMGGGLKVFIMDRRDDWSRVLLTNGESGWVHNEDISEIKI